MVNELLTQQEPAVWQQEQGHPMRLPYGGHGEQTQMSHSDNENRNSIS